METHTFPPIEVHSTPTAALNTSAVDDTTMNSLLSWAVRPPEQDARNAVRKAQVSRTPKIKMGVFLGRSPTYRQVLATWALGVAPSGMSFRGSDMSLNMRLLAV